MSSILVLSGSPSASSRTGAVVQHLGQRLHGQGHEVHTEVLRELPADALLAGDSANPRVAQAAESLAAADGVIVGSPVYKAAYSGLLKAFLDLLPQFALERKVVLPLATGGSPAHVLAIDYAFRPVLTSLGAEHVVQGYFLLDKLIERTDNGVIIDPSAEGPLLSVVDAFSEQLHRRERLALVS